jgi:tetratricopeptide (TPR) repeat protein
MKDLVARFQARVGGLDESGLLLLRLSDEIAHRMRLCAIPHSFDAEILRVLEPGLTPAAAEAFMTECRDQPEIVQIADCLALHDVVREQLFRAWLTPERHAEFAAASQRLAEHYRSPAGATAAAAVRQRAYIFHLLGADLDNGFREFQRVYRERRDQSRFSECESLVRLLHEYEPALGPGQRAWMRYYEAEVADDNRQLAQAAERLETLLRETIPDEVRCMALLRLGSLRRRMGQFEAAERRCRECLKLSARLATGGTPARLVHNELGIVARDRGDFDEARRELELALDLAKAEGDCADLAMAYNSYGTLLLKPAPREAVAALDACLKLLDPRKDGVRIAQVLNNLGLAYADLGEWNESADYYSRSLEIKRAAADVHGLASTLLNIARVHRARNDLVKAREALTESAALFGRVKEPLLAARVHRELARMAIAAGVTAEVAVQARQMIEFFAAAGNEPEAAATRREFRLDGGHKRRRWILWIILAVLVAIILLMWMLIDGFAHAQTFRLGLASVTHSGVRNWPIAEMPAAARHSRLLCSCGLCLVQGRICDRLSRAQPAHDNQLLHILERRPVPSPAASAIGAAADAPDSLM